MPLTQPGPLLCNWKVLMILHLGYPSDWMVHSKSTPAPDVYTLYMPSLQIK